MLVSVSPRDVTVNVTPLETRFPFCAVIVALPACATRFAGTADVICVELTNVETSALPFQLMIVLVLKPVPFTVRLKAGLPATAVLGEILVMLSDGDVTVNVTPLETRFPFCAVIVALPACATRFAGTAAVICVELTGVETSALPFQLTTVLVLKPVPLTVRLKAGLPATAVLDRKSTRLNS